MKTITPDYYSQFRCIADACTHSCCIGWEIDIDESAAARYAAMDGPMGRRLRESIDFTADPPHFILGEGERCPLLRADGLCDLICACGESALCGICADHPRFRNEFSDRTELGLGLCCEAAAGLILRRTEPMTLVGSDDGIPAPPLDEEEQTVLTLRRQAIAIAQDRDFPVAERMEHLCLWLDTPMPDPDPARWAEVYLALERLDEDWTALTEQLRGPLPEITPEELPMEQLLVYFLYRHLPGALSDGDVTGRVRLAILSTMVLDWLRRATGLPLTELARMYSAEIEYSDENVDALLDALWES